MSSGYVWKIINRCLLTIFGPTLYGLYDEDYQENFLESVGNKGCAIMFLIYRVGLGLLPVTVYVFWNNLYGYTRTFVIAYSLLITIRMFGRFFSADYSNMITLLVKHNENPSNKSALNKVFQKYNISLSMVEGLKLTYPAKSPLIEEYIPTQEDGILVIVFAWFATNFMGRRLVFPGSVSLLKYLMRSHVNLERSVTMKKWSAERIPVTTRKGNVLDTLFIDRRGKSGILIIISDGNAGYCERGLSQPWINAGYSTLTYNAPGIGESSGTPYHDQLCDGAEAIMTLALKLGFSGDSICLYGWSIGGFASAWMAANYPVRGVVLDATFDNLLPLAENVTGMLAPVTTAFAIKFYFNMNVSKLIVKYFGPIMFVRRRSDEVVVTDRSESDDAYKTNRINFLFKDFLAIRYHFLFWTTFDDIVVDEWLDADDNQRRDWVADDGLDADLYEYIPRDVETSMELDVITRTSIVRRICNWHFTDLLTTHNPMMPSMRCLVPEDLFPPGTELPPPPA